jgi:hypothetical protein
MHISLDWLVIVKTASPCCSSIKIIEFFITVLVSFFISFFKNIALKNHPGIGSNCHQCRVKKPPFPSGRWEWIEGAVVNNPVI